MQANTGDNAYKLDLINLNTSAGTLVLTATQGDNAAANTLKNGLQVAIDAVSRPFTIAARLKGSSTTTLTTAEQQGGIFLGSSQDNYVKLVTTNLGRNLHFFSGATRIAGQANDTDLCCSLSTVAPSVGCHIAFGHSVAGLVGVDTAGHRTAFGHSVAGLAGVDTVDPRSVAHRVVAVWRSPAG